MATAPDRLEALPAGHRNASLRAGELSKSWLTVRSPEEGWNPGQRGAYLCMGHKNVLIHFEIRRKELVGWKYFDI